MDAPATEHGVLLAVPTLAFLAAFAGTLLLDGDPAAIARAEHTLIVSLVEPQRLPAAYLNVVELDGARGRRITSEPQGARLATAFDLQPDWSPAAGLIAFARETFTEGGLGSPSKIWAVRPDGADLRQLTRGPEVDRLPAWSPDGTRIAFVRDNGGAFEIFVIEADGSRQIQLTTDSSSADEFPAWSPDARRIAYSSTSDGASDLFVINADGSGARQITGGSDDDSAPAWSPDGMKIVFLRDGDVHVASTGGDDVRALTHDGQALTRPRWSADGETILFGDDRGQVYLVPAEGDEPERVPIAGEALWPIWKEDRRS